MQSLSRDATDHADLTDDQQAYVEGLHQLADFLAARPGLINRYSTALILTPFADDKAALGRLARLMGTADKSVDDNYFSLKKQFGPHALMACAVRDEVCERVVVGTETLTVEEPDPEQVAALPKVTRKATREVVEWRCPDSILAPLKAVG